MKCLSCEAQINPKWKHAIENNICPCCGELIMPEELKNGLMNLKKCIESLSNYQEPLEDWLFHNYKLMNITTNAFAKMVDSAVKERNIRKKYEDIEKDEEDESEEDEALKDSKLISKGSQEQTNKFFKNAGVDHLINKNKNKKIASQIKASSSDEQELLLDDNVDPLDNKELNEIKSMISGDESYINSSIDKTEDDSEEKIHPAAYQLADKISKSNKSQTNRDYEKLKNLHDRLAQSRENVLSGTGGKGSFSRA